MKLAYLWFAALVFPTLAPGAEAAKISSAKADQDGILTHDVESPLQAGPIQIRVLRPERLSSEQRCPVIYVLPVEAGRECRYGDGMLEVKRLDLHNKHRAIFVAPTFSHLPWYCDHPTNPAIRQETYMVEEVVPFIDRTYPTRAEPKGRLLLGFSKSGWGAWSLLLRHPNLFGRAAAWDAPLMMDRLGKFGTSEIFSTQENFEKYRLVDRLRAKSASLQNEPRLALLGYGNFREHHREAHVLLDELKIPHEYQDGPPREHDWQSGWLAEAVEMLLKAR